MKIKVLKLDKKFFDGDAEKVVLPASDGEICLLSNHVPLVTTLKKGILKIFKHDIEAPVVVEVDEGICSFSNNKATFILY